MTENMKAIMRRWSNALFTEDIRKQYGVTRQAVFNSATLQELDNVYTKRIMGFKSVQDFYKSMSSCHHMKNIRVPMVFLNALDDPIVPPQLLEIPRDVALNNENIIFIEQKFGGHLGFYEGGFIYSNPLTWQDRILVKIGHALTTGYSPKAEPKEKFELTEGHPGEGHPSGIWLKGVPSAEAGDDHPSGIWLKGLMKQESVESDSGDLGHNFLKPNKIPFFETPVTSEMSSVESGAPSGEDTEADLETEADLDDDSDDGGRDGRPPHTCTPPNTPIVPRSRKPLKGLI